MVRVDLNPFQAGGSVNPLSKNGVVKAVMMMASFGLFFALMAAGQATFQPIVESVLNAVPGLSTQSGDDNGAWGGW